MIKTHTKKQQYLRCTISLFLDFPQYLQELKDNGKTLISITLEYLEKRLPGIYNMRIARIELQPIAIMDPMRFIIILTNNGWGLIRTKGRAIYKNGQDELHINKENTYNTQGLTWFLHSNANLKFPIKKMLTPVETYLFTGVTTAESCAYFQSYTPQQKAAFEDCPAASVWHVDMSMPVNRVVSGSLDDLILTFYITGIYDADLNALISEAL